MGSIGEDGAAALKAEAHRLRSEALPLRSDDCLLRVGLGGQRQTENALYQPVIAEPGFERRLGEFVVIGEVGIWIRLQNGYVSVG